MTSTNPFDDISDEAGNGDTFDSNMNANINMDTNDTNNFQGSSAFNNSLPNMNMSAHNFSADTNLDDIGEEDADMPIEASWQFLGDLPYRCIPIFKNVSWRKEHPNADAPFSGGNGLAAYPSSWLQAHKDSNSSLLSDEDLKQLFVTKVTGCPNGGPIAAITLPNRNMTNPNQMMTTTELRIMMPSGRHLANIEFPPPKLISKYTRQPYTASDVLSIGFTDRMLLIVLLRDSLCFTYNLRGQPVIAPFHILIPNMAKGNINAPPVVELLEASFFNGGVAVLSETQQMALVEFFDEHDDPAYMESAHYTARKISPAEGIHSSEYMSISFGTLAAGASPTSTNSPSYSAIITSFPTDVHARTNGNHYCALAVLPRNHTASQHPEVFLSTSDKSVIIADAYNLSITDVDCRQRITSPITSMSFAPNGRFLACFTKSLILTVISTTFETKVLDFDTSEGSNSPPSQMKWCGEDSVVLHWKNLGVLMVGPYGDWLRFPYDFTDDLFLIPEIDCCRIITDRSTDIIQRVPPATALFLRIGSIEPSAMLLDASDAFENGSPASDEAARAVSRTGLLIDAVETCAEAAMREFDVAVQKRLLRAASYGMHFVYKDQLDNRKVMGGEGKVDFRELQEMDRDPDEEDASMGYGTMSSNVNDLSNVRPSPTAKIFVAAAKKLRILNALRHPAVGFAMTSAQFDAITPMGIVARLVEVKRPSLAATISSYLALEKSVQTFARVSRAAAFIASDKGNSDTQTAEFAIKLLNEDALGLITGRKSSSAENKNSKSGQDSYTLNRGGYASVALAAKDAGRPEVAKLLLRLETSIPDKVKGLIAIEAYDGAVSVASDSK